MNSIEKKVIDKIEDLRYEIIKFHQKIVQIPSENPPGKYKEISRFVEDKFKELGLQTTVKRKNVIGTYGHSESPSMILYGHMDTVPKYDGWTKDPFGGEIINKRIYGRGACDDKACVTAAIFATKALIDLGIDLPGKLKVISVIDEETGGFRGAKYLLDKKHIDSDVCLLGDGRGGFPAAFTGGFALGTIEIKGKKAHALSFPDIPIYRNEYSGINAIQKMVKVCDFFIALQKKYLKKETKYPNFPGHPSKVTTISLAKIQGGDKISSVPDSCLLYFTINTIPEQSVELIKKEIESYVEESKREDPDLDIKLNFTFSFEPFETDTNGKFALSMKYALKDVYGEEREFKMFQAANDGHWFHEAGIETILLGVGTHENNVHAEDEYVSIADLVATTKICALTILNYFKVT
ncbi:MAG: M20/M25/M40 family metallo-hydrolase [Candidatus Lokiarchaeota archaeon]|nr:M20/M25/M40 family metallo-hydrolase [Candidatus Lokiarchaeota archaeon]MBD3338719.1 M20/M25/M40 family metallo-hydrolase [Candidatus Lokiarchaeota archaeon]